MLKGIESPCLIVLSCVEIINAFRDAAAKRLAVSSANLMFKTLRSVFTAARREGLIDDNPAERVTILKRRYDFERRAFTLPELKRIMELADEEYRLPARQASHLFPRPIFAIPKLDDVSSNEVSFAERAHWMTQSRRSHALTWGFSLLIADALRLSTIICPCHRFARPCRYECDAILFSYR
jgi:integrase